MTGWNDPSPEVSSPQGVDFGQCLVELQTRKSLPGDSSSVTLDCDVWQYDQDCDRMISDVAQSVADALQCPVDFPPLDVAVVEGDRVALAVDANLPQLSEVVIGVVRSLRGTNATHVDVVLTDEATAATVDSVRHALIESGLSDHASVDRHVSTDRESLRYLGADADALPWYVNRQLVDADVVLPIVTARPGQSDGLQDLTGIYPEFTDSATRNRFRDAFSQIAASGMSAPENQIPWLIGIQLMMTVTANQAGHARSIVAGTPKSLAVASPGSKSNQHETPSAAAIVIASTDGEAQQQTWANAARAAVAASRLARPGGTIMVWSDIREPPSDSVLRILESNDDSHWADAANSADPGSDEAGSMDDPSDSETLPPWDESIGIALAFSKVMVDHRVVIRSRLEPEVVESLGFGSLKSVDQLRRYLGSFETCGVLRAAQFAGGSALARRQSGIQQ